MPTLAQDTLLFQGQASAWAHYNSNNDLPIGLGARYIPQINYNIKLEGNKLIDFEGSANTYGFTGFNPFDTINVDGGIRPYRIWARYSSNQLELRLGLQKINFGSAAMLRPLMWFDQIDPRDPLQLTDGVYGLLGRYYFLNNANIWLWALYGNEEPKTWEIGKTSQNMPELGGRFQMPVPRGEAAITYHYRNADTRGLGLEVLDDSEIPEHRFGLDGKWDAGAGLWFEAVWINKTRNAGTFTNQELLNAGADYTFGWGNGLNVMYEQLLFSYDETPFKFNQSILFSALSMSYPLGISDNLNAIVYFDWTNRAAYNFLNWKKQIKNISLYFMAYWNPKDYRIPVQGDAGSLFSGRGIQIMMVYNH